VGPHGANDAGSRGGAGSSSRARPTCQFGKGIKKVGLRRMGFDLRTSRETSKEQTSGTMDEI
jgi:hypothetical protein